MQYNLGSFKTPRIEFLTFVGSILEIVPVVPLFQFNQIDDHQKVAFASLRSPSERITGISHTKWVDMELGGLHCRFEGHEDVVAEFNKLQGKDQLVLSR